MKPRVLLVCDRYGWANEQACRALARFLVDAFEVRIIANSEVNIGTMGWADLLYSSIYYGRGAEHPCSVTQISSPSYFIRRRKRMDGFPERLLEWSYVVAKNTQIAGMLSDEDHPHRRLLYHHLDPWKYTPGDRHYRLNGPLRVGYAGHDKPAKGVHLIREAAERLGDQVELHELTFNGSPIPPDRMPDWYRGLDVYVCASQPGKDAGPRPPMEAGLCGCAVVTTIVGQIGEMVQDGVQGLTTEWTADGIHQALSHLVLDRALLVRVGECAALEFSQRWALDVGYQWRDYFLELLHANEPTSPAP